MPKCIRILGLIKWVFCNVGEVEVCGLAKRSKFDLALILETKLKVGPLAT
jgi:hypothetical protein